MSIHTMTKKAIFVKTQKVLLNEKGFNNWDGWFYRLPPL